MESHGLSRSFTLQKPLNQWRCHFGWGLGGPKEPWSRCPIVSGNFERKEGGPLQRLGTPCRELCKNSWTDQDVVWDMACVGLRKHVLDGVHIGTTYWIRLSRPCAHCAVAMQPHVKLFWPLVPFAETGSRGRLPSNWRECVVDVSGLDNQALVERIQEQVNSALMEYCASEYADVHDKFGQLLVLLNELRLVSLSAEEFLYASGTISDNTLLMEMLHSRQT